MMIAIFFSFFEISVSMSIVVVLLLLLTPLLNKRYALKWKCWIWILLALRLILPFAGNGGRPAADLQRQRLEEGTARRRVTVEIPAQMTAPVVELSERNSSSISMLDLIAFVWMLGSLSFVSAHLISYFYCKRQILKKGRAVKDWDFLYLLVQLKQKLQIKRTVSVIEYSGAASPMMIGFFHPVLVLPKGQYHPEEQFFILKHELIHLKRGDLYWKLLFVLANAVHWFNPLIWIMRKEASVDMELSCDERVIQGADYATRKAYTETLLSTLHKRSAKGTVLSTGLYGGKEIMKRRFQNIFVKTGKKNGAAVWICTAALTVGLGTLVGCSVAKESVEDGAETEQAGSIAPTEMPGEVLNDPDYEYFLLTWNPLLLDYYNTYEGQKKLAADFADLGGEGMSVSISVIGDDILVVTVRYEDSSLLTEGIEEALAQQLDAMTDRFQEQRSLYCTDVIGPASVRILAVEYIDREGNILARQDYAGQ